MGAAGLSPDCRLFHPSLLMSKFSRCGGVVKSKPASPAPSRLAFHRQQDLGLLGLAHGGTRCTAQGLVSTDTLRPAQRVLQPREANQTQAQTAPPLHLSAITRSP